LPCHLPIRMELGVVEALLKSYNESHRGFAVVRDARLLHVVPRKARGLSGNLELVKPVLDTVITIEPRERTSDALLEEVCNQISIATNTHVVFGTISMNLLTLTKTSIGGSGTTARSILEQWIRKDAPNCRVGFYSPDEKDYSLNIGG
jgi:hypothetical protein